MRPSNEVSGVDNARPGGGFTVYVAPCADAGRVETTIHEDGGVVIVIIDNDGQKLADFSTAMKVTCEWSMRDALKALGDACRSASATAHAYATNAERLAQFLKDTYKERFYWHNGNRAARRAGQYSNLSYDPPKRRWPVPPRYLVCKGRRKYK